MLYPKDKWERYGSLILKERVFTVLTHNYYSNSEARYVISERTRHGKGREEGKVHRTIAYYRDDTDDRLQNEKAAVTDEYALMKGVYFE